MNTDNPGHPDPAMELDERFQQIVLVVDDSEFDRKVFGAVLEEELYDLVLSNGCLEALAVLERTLPDLILLDMDMPEIDGLQTLQRLKADLRLAGIPVMMVTGHSERDVVLRCLKAGAIDFTVKPLDRVSFLAKVRKILDTAD